MVRACVCLCAVAWRWYEICEFWNGFANSFPKTERVHLCRYTKAGWKMAPMWRSNAAASTRSSTPTTSRRKWSFCQSCGIIMWLVSSATVSSMVNPEIAMTDDSWSSRNSWTIVIFEPIYLVIPAPSTCGNPFALTRMPESSKTHPLTEMLNFVCGLLLRAQDLRIL